MTTNSVLQEVALERYRQMKKWGEQNHPLGTDPQSWPLDIGIERIQDCVAEDLAQAFTDYTDGAAKNGQLTWLDILLEEVFEFTAESDPAAARAEAIQVAAVAVAIVESIDRSERG